MKESQNTEFKTSWRNEYLKWICGYANADGGILYIGKDDNGNVVGLTHIKKLLEDIPNKVRDILASQPHNPDIANALFRAGMIEAWGRGIEKISQACLESGSSRFEIQHEPNGLWLIFFFSGGKSSAKTTVETPDAIIRLMAEKPDITLAEIAAHIEKSVRTVERAAAKLKKEGKITFKGPKKGGRWEILV